jgi:hypothetical protein
MMMRRRTLIAILGLTFAAPILAGRGSPSAADESDGGAWDGVGDGSSSGTGPDAGTPSGGDNSGSTPSDSEAARRAVEDKLAIPLIDMMAIFTSSIAGEVVDVSLVEGGAGALRYRFKYIDEQGHVRRAYFDALTGRKL